jgi:hypothetical protein
LRRPVERRPGLEALEDRVLLSDGLSRAVPLPAMWPHFGGDAGGHGHSHGLGLGQVEASKTTKQPPKTVPLPAQLSGPDSNGKVTITGKAAARGVVHVALGVGGPVVATA